MPRNPDQAGASREALEQCQRERLMARRRFATLMELWRACGNKPCLRARACAGPGDAPCAIAFMRSMPEEVRATLQRAITLRLAGAGTEAAWDEAERTVAEHDRNSRA